MKIGLFTWVFNDRPFEDVLRFASGLGYEAVELAVDKGRDNHLNMDKILSGGITEFKKKVENYGLEISALSSYIDS
jgi:sugar phosphate isomerase/epimerase